jgi:hypothetical protein
MGGDAVFDPQLYNPDGFHDNILKYPYASLETAARIASGDCPGTVSLLAEINTRIGAEAFILPSALAARIDDHWLGAMNSKVKHARDAGWGKKLWITFALGGKVLLDGSQVESMINCAGSADIDGVYIVSEYPESCRYEGHPLWLSNLMFLTAGIKRLGKYVLVGYADHRSLPLALAKCDAIASGGLPHSRRFQPERFQPDQFNPLEKEGRAGCVIRYYCPHALSEFPLSCLDTARRIDTVNARAADLLAALAPPVTMANRYSKGLFEASLPSAFGYGESESARHYLHCLKIQCEEALRSSYTESKAAQFSMMRNAACIVSTLHKLGIHGGHWDFDEFKDANTAAISLFDDDLGFVMSRQWDEV